MVNGIIVAEEWKNERGWVMSRNERPAPHLPQFRSAATIAQFTIWLCFTDWTPETG